MSIAAGRRTILVKPRDLCHSVSRPFSSNFPVSSLYLSFQATNARLIVFYFLYPSRDLPFFPLLQAVSTEEHNISPGDSFVASISLACFCFYFCQKNRRRTVPRKAASIDKSHLKSCDENVVVDCLESGRGQPERRRRSTTFYASGGQEDQRGAEARHSALEKRPIPYPATIDTSFFGARK